MDRLEWQEEILKEKIEEELIRLAKNVIDVLDDETVAKKLGLGISLIENLRD